MSKTRINGSKSATMLRVLTEVSLVLAIAFVCSQVFWQFVAPAKPITQALSAPDASQTRYAQQAEQNAANFSILTTSNPFSPRDEGTQSTIDVEALDAPETSLNLTLKGLRANGEGQGVAFILLPDNRQVRAGVGEEILDNVEVEYVFEDRITLRTRGELETLYLREAGASRTGLTAALPAYDDAPVNFEDGQDISALMFLRSVSVTPVRENGAPTGFSLTPKTDAGIMQAVGFESDDIIREVNSLSAAEIDSEDLQELLLHSTIIEFEVERAGETVRVLAQFAQGVPR